MEFQIDLFTVIIGTSVIVLSVVEIISICFFIYQCIKLDSTSKIKIVKPESIIKQESKTNYKIIIKNDDSILDSTAEKINSADKIYLTRDNNYFMASIYKKNEDRIDLKWKFIVILREYSGSLSVVDKLEIKSSNNIIYSYEELYKRRPELSVVLKNLTGEL